MRYKPLATTGVEIPEIGLGTWQYKGGTTPLREGIASGASFIDTAEAYGTETVVGEAVQGMRDKVFIATKASPQHFGHQNLMKAADLSLKRLGINHIDLYQLHWPNPDIPIEETMGAMDALVDSGKVRFIGVSNFSVAQLQKAQAAARNPVVSNQVKYNLLERGIERDLLPYCQERGVTVIAYSPLGHNIRHLTAALGNELRQVAQQTGKTVAQVALNWCLSRANVVVIPKSNSLEHTLENCGASDWDLSQEHLRLLEQA